MSDQDELPLEHDPTGLDLAASLAPGVKGARPRPRRKLRKPRSGDARWSSAVADDRDPQRVGDIVTRMTREQGWQTEVAAHALLAQWSRIVGPAVAEHSAPESFEDTVLTVRTTSTAWATQLRLMAPTIVARLNDTLGQGSVTRVDVRGPEAPSWKHGRRSIRGARGPRDTYG